MALDGGEVQDWGIQPGAEPRFAPFCYEPLEKDAPFFKALYYLSKNPIELLTRELYENAVSEKTFLGRRAFFLNEPELTKYFFVDRSDVYTIDPVRKLLLKPGFGSGLASIDGAAWEENRSLTRRYFKSDRLLQYADKFLRTTKDACREIGSEAEVDLQRFLSRIGLRSAIACLFSTEAPFGIDRSVEAFNNAMKYHMTVDAADVFLLPHFVPRFWKRSAARPLRTCHRIAKAVVDARIAEMQGGEVPDDLLSAYFDKWVSGDRPTRAERRHVQDNVGTMLGASFETTSLTMTWTLYFLLNCPASAAKVEEEIAAAPHRGEPLTRWGKALPYTTAVLMEALRVYPILPAIVRYATEEDGAGLPEAHIRSGDFIVANLWTQHRDESRWSDAQTFRPERFLNRTEAVVRQGGYFPFGIGPRGCIGAQFAMIEAVIVLVTLLETFELELLASDEVRPQWRGTLRPDRPIPVRLRRRAIH